MENNHMGEMVSIIVPVFNAEKTLDRCIESILQQTYLNLELILVNDGSKDASLAICEKYQKDRRVCVYTQENGGPSKARNFGLLKSMGDYIVFVDSDDYIESNLLERCINKIEKGRFSENHPFSICFYLSIYSSACASLAESASPILPPAFTRGAI